MPDIDLLKEISQKLSQLIVLMKLSNSKAIAEFKEEIEKDIVLKEILRIADGQLTSAQLTEKVVQQTKVAERTVKRRISDLIEKGGLNYVRKGKEIYYENSGLYE